MVLVICPDKIYQKDEYYHPEIKNFTLDLRRGGGTSKLFCKIWVGVIHVGGVIDQMG